MARTKRSRRSYGAGEWGRNRVRIFPDPKTGIFQIEWRENGRRRTRSLGHRDWVRAKRQSDKGLNHGRESSKVKQDCTICVSCRSTVSDSIQPKQRGNRIGWRELRGATNGPSILRLLTSIRLRRRSNSSRL